jgi:hypothetical protein
LQAQNHVALKILKGTKLNCCPHCKTATMVTIEVFGKRGPPARYLLQQEINPA